MGLFLSLAVMVDVTEPELADALASYAATKGGTFSREAADTDEADRASLVQTATGTAIRYPDSFFEWDDASQHLSRMLKKAVFSFHIHDGDFWMFRLFKDGEALSQYNPMPEYWEELPPAEKAEWAGDPAIVAAQVYNVATDAIARYFIEWTDELLDADEPEKAYPGDEFAIGNCWQVLDFLRRLQLPISIDEEGGSIGTAYQLRIPHES